MFLCVACFWLCFPLPSSKDKKRAKNIVLKNILKRLRCLFFLSCYFIFFLYLFTLSFNIGRSFSSSHRLSKSESKVLSKTWWYMEWKWIYDDDDMRQHRKTHSSHTKGKHYYDWLNKCQYTGECEFFFWFYVKRVPQTICVISDDGSVH